MEQPISEVCQLLPELIIGHDGKVNFTWVYIENYVNVSNCHLMKRVNAASKAELDFTHSHQQDTMTCQAFVIHRCLRKSTGILIETFMNIPQNQQVQQTLSLQSWLVLLEFTVKDWQYNQSLIESNSLGKWNLIKSNSLGKWNFIMYANVTVSLTLVSNELDHRHFLHVIPMG